MTGAFNDICAVTHLIAEKERDLELAAHIGQKLLADNDSLNTKVDSLEEQLHQATEKINQLKHILCVRDALLKAYIREEAEFSESPALDGAGAVGVSALQRKVLLLEEENVQLKAETAQLSNETVDYEERGNDLVRDCVRRLTECVEEIDVLEEELDAKMELSDSLQDKASRLMLQVAALERKVQQLTNENTELGSQTSLSLQAQRNLVEEIMDWEEQYAECCNLLEEARKEIRGLRKKQAPSVIHYHYTQMSPYISSESLAVELEKSFRRDVDLLKGYSPDERKLHSLHVMRTGHAVRRTRLVRSAPVRTSSVPEKSEVNSISNESYSEDHGRGVTRFEAGPGRPRPSAESFASPGSSCLCSDEFTRMMCVQEKLQIVKPLEGSETLHQWQYLATPHLGHILEPRPGIQIKGEVGSDVFEEDPYSLSDYEEDDDFSPAFVKCLESTSSTYTFTMSKVTHPSEYRGMSSPTCTAIAPDFCSSTSVSMTLMTDIENALAASETVSPVACTSAPVSPAGRRPWTPPRLDRCTSTFSTSAALARVLQERNAGVDGTVGGENVRDKERGSDRQSGPGLPNRFQSIAAVTVSESLRSSAESFCATPSGRDRMTHRSRCSVTRNPVDIGLNSIISIKRSRSLSTSSGKSVRKQRYDDYRIMQRRYSPPNANYRELLSLLEDIRKNFLSEKKRRSAEKFGDDVAMHCAEDASGNDGTDVVSDVTEGVYCRVTVPRILISSEPASPTSSDFSLSADSPPSFF